MPMPRSWHVLVAFIGLICAAQYAVQSWISALETESSSNLPSSLLSFTHDGGVIHGNDGPLLARRVAAANEKPPGRPGCAVLFFGLPRSFRTLVLPSVVRNVIATNRRHECDFFVHYYNITAETAGRSGGGGQIQADAILLLREAVQQEQFTTSTTSSLSPRTRTPAVLFASDTNETFYQAHKEMIQQVLEAKDESGQKPLFYPWLEKDYVFPDTILNIFKMWHSIDRAWNLMEEYGRNRRIRYKRVAMLRSDVVFLTPLDIWDTGNGTVDADNSHVVIPSFARYPVNDRAIYGNASGVRTWATQRFDGLVRHVQEYRGSGYVLHHEHFVDSVLLSDIRKRGIHVTEHPSLCFCRARADQRVWFNDCTSGSSSLSLKQTYRNASMLLQSVEEAVGRSCGDVRKEPVSAAMSALCLDVA